MFENETQVMLDASFAGQQTDESALEAMVRTDFTSWTWKGEKGEVC